MSEKTEQPTPKKLQDAREKGQVAKSREVTTCAVIVGLFIYFWLFFDDYLERLKYLVGISPTYYDTPFDQALVSCMKIVVQEFALLTIPIVVAAMAIATVAYLMQIGFLVSFEAVKPDMGRINPVQGIKRIFSLNSLLELVKSIVKIVLLGSIIYLIARQHIEEIIHIHDIGHDSAWIVFTAVLKKLAVAVSALFIVIAIIDFFFQKHLFVRKLKMSKEEIRREYKDREGDPYLKQQRKRLQMEMVNDDMAAKIKEATVVLAKSTETAIVVHFEMGKTPLPVVSIKGKKLVAERIVSMAKQYGIPIHSDADLAQKIYDDCQQDNYITRDYIEPVAMILRRIMGLDGKKP